MTQPAAELSCSMIVIQVQRAFSWRRAAQFAHRGTSPCWLWQTRSLIRSAPSLFFTSVIMISASVGRMQTPGASSARHQSLTNVTMWARLTGEVIPTALSIGLFARDYLHRRQKLSSGQVLTARRLCIHNFLLGTCRHFSDNFISYSGKNTPRAISPRETW